MGRHTFGRFRSWLYDSTVAAPLLSICLIAAVCLTIVLVFG